jgi:GTPase-associated protein 1, N-terminal domain type 2/GTPase-associated protein 1, middle domain
MIEQLWYTWSTVGLGSVTGFRVRAASSGLADIRSERFRVLERYLHYDLPVGVDPYEANTENAPYCLSLLDVADTRILVHKVYIGKDAYGRPGVHFIHLLEGLPHTFLAQNAIQFWKSPFWQQSDRDPSMIDCELKQIASIQELSPGSLDRYALKALEEELLFIIQAYLSLQPQQKLYIAAQPEQVAALIWGLTRSLPPVLQHRLTFSTYERDAHDVDALVIGSCWSPDIQHDFPSQCYEKQGLALNSYSGKRSLLEGATLEASYARFATSCLTSANGQRLDELLRIANEMGISDVGSLLVLYELFTAKSLARDRMTKLLETFELAAGLLAQEGIQDSIFQLTRDDPQWWSEHGKKAIAILRARQHNERGMSVVPGLNSLAERAATKAASALLSGDKKTCDACLLVLFEAAPVGTNPAPWLHLLHHFVSSIETGAFQPSELKNWELRAWLLKNWASAAQSIDTQLILPWLQVSWEELQLLLSLPLPSRWYTLAIVDLLTHSAHLIPPSIPSIVMDKQAIFDEALRSLMQDAQRQQLALDFFATLVSYGYPHKIKLLSVLLQADKQGNTIELLLQAARLTDKERAYLFKQHTQLFLAFNPFPGEILGLIAAYVNSLTVDDLSDTVVLHMLQFLQKNAAKLPEDDKRQIWNRKMAAEAISEENTPLQFDTTSLTALGNAIRSLQLYNKETYIRKLYLSLSRNIRIIEELRNVVTVLAPALGVTSSLFLRDLAVCRGGMYKNGLSHRPLLPYITLACEYAGNAQAPSQEQFLLPTLRALLKNVDRRTFDEIDQEAERWTPETRKQWRACSADLRPTNMMTRISDSVTNLFPFRKPPSQAISQDWVARVWPPSAKAKRVPYADFDRLYILQNLYIPARKGELQKIKEVTDQKWVQDERNMLLQLTDPNHALWETREMLINDVLIVHEFTSGKAAKYHPEPTLEEKREEIFREINKQPDYHKYIAKHAFTDQDVKEVLNILLRYRYFAQYLWEQEKLVLDWLKFKKKQIKIERSEHLSLKQGEKQ